MATRATATLQHAVSRVPVARWTPDFCALNSDGTQVCHNTPVPALSPKWIDRVTAFGSLSGGAQASEPDTTKLEGFSGTQLSLQRDLPTPQGYLLEVFDHDSAEVWLLHIASTGKLLWKAKMTDQTSELDDLGVTADGRVLYRLAGVVSALDLASGEKRGRVGKGYALIAASPQDIGGVSVPQGDSVGVPITQGGTVLTPSSLSGLRGSRLAGPSRGCSLDSQVYADASLLITRDESKRTTTAWAADGSKAWSLAASASSAHRVGDVVALSGDAAPLPGRRITFVSATTGRVIGAVRTQTAVRLIGADAKGVYAALDRPKDAPGPFGGADEVDVAYYSIAATSQEQEAPARSTPSSAAPSMPERVTSRDGTLSFVVPATWKRTSDPSGERFTSSSLPGMELGLSRPDGVGLDSCLGAAASVDEGLGESMTSMLLPTIEGLSVSSPVRCYGAPSLNETLDAAHVSFGVSMHRLGNPGGIVFVAGAPVALSAATDELMQDEAKLEVYRRELVGFVSSLRVLE